MTPTIKQRALSALRLLKAKKAYRSYLAGQRYANERMRLERERQARPIRRTSKLKRIRL